MVPMKVGIAQIKNTVSIDENIKNIEQALEVFRTSAVDLILFPECALSGFSAKMKDCTPILIEPMLQKIQAWAHLWNKTVVLPTALCVDQKIYNTGFILSSEARTQFYKLVLTESEKNFFSTPTESTAKTFTCKGLKFALLICYEAELDPWTFFAHGEIDCILWPGYWGWEEKDEWSALKSDGTPNKIFDNMKHWQVPLIQANFACNELAGHTGAGPMGLSIYVDKENQLKARGDFNRPSCHEYVILSQTTG